MPRASRVFTAFSCTILLAIAGAPSACSSSDSANPIAADSGATVDSGASDANADADGGSGKTFADKGVVLDYITRKPLADITLSEGGITAKTDATGAYSMTLPADTPVELVLTGGEYTKTFIAEVSLAADYSRIVPIPQLALYHVGVNSFDGYDATRGVVYIVARATGSCTDVSGGSITLKSPADAKVAYFTDKLPDMDRKTFKWVDDDTPVAAVYNVPAGQQVDIQIDHPTCKHMPFPATVKGATYTGRVTVEAGDANSVLIHHLQ
jgi:hypothetical protein